ncbi:MAG: hypothetical protein H7Z14_06350 [Anaerolineae bacterium]|nr:hypothetical protein [Phycisphaerae bacterium]
MMKRNAQLQRRPMAPCIDPLEPRTMLAVQLVADIDREGSGFTDDSRPTAFASFKGETYFIAEQAPASGEIPKVRWWKSDGTPGGTVALTLLDNGIAPGFDYNSVELGGKLFVSGGQGLWSTDGTVAGTQPVAGLGATTPHLLTLAGRLLYFEVGDPSITTLQVWRSDGTSDGTYPLTSFSSNTGTTTPVALGNYAYFCNTTAGPDGTLYRTNGTVPGTIPLKPVGVNTFLVMGRTVRSFRSSVWFFAKADGVRGLYRTDGTAAGTVRVRTFSGIADNPVVLGGVGKSIYFAVRESAGSRDVLWKSDGTEAGTVAVKDLTSDVNVSDISAMASTSSRIFFWIREKTVFTENFTYLWTSDGTARGTKKVSATVRVNDGTEEHVQSAIADNVLYFKGFDQTDVAHAFAQRVFRSDGTPAGTTPVSPYSLHPLDQLTSASNTLYFRATDWRKGTEPWRLTTPSSLGTIAGNVFLDPDANGKRTAGEAALRNWVVYLDKNRDGKLTTGEKFRRTDSRGRYSFTGLTAGNYQVRLARVAGYSSSTQPNTADASFDVALQPGDGFERHFGNVKNAGTRALARVATNPFNKHPPIHDLLDDVDL